MKRVLLDQGLPAKVTSILRMTDWDVVHVREIAMSKAQDEDILDFAARDSRVAVTLDRDFPQILALTAAKRPSVVLIRQQRLSAAAQLRRSLHPSGGNMKECWRAGVLLPSAHTAREFALCR
jgi:predicted nuclease of predicted toxin-antitoxin system